MVNWDEIKLKATEWVKEAGELIKHSFHDQITVSYKSNPSDLVTNMDHSIEQYLIKQINDHYPDHRILGEEGFGDSVKNPEGTLWIIDPIDGTMNFVHQQRNFTISVAVYHEGEGIIGLIYDVVRDELYHAQKGKGSFLDQRQLKQLTPVSVDQALIGMNATWVTENTRIDPFVLAPLVRDARGVRSYGSAALEMAYVASGILDAYITLRLSPWDFAAGLILLREVGGLVTTLEGKEIELLEQNSIFAGRPGLHQDILTKYIQGNIPNA